jgi:cbb3-type cytochrome oxidase subunit 3
VGEWGFVVAGYTATAAVLAGYVWSLFRRARRARERAAAVVEERSA